MSSKMNKKIFKSSIFIALAVLAASIILIMGILYRHFQNQLVEQLKKEVVYISAALENEGTGYLDSINENQDRITLISPDGTVLADTQADAAQLENHMDRQEVKDAAEKGSGSSIRYSDTLTEKIIYYAVKLDNGNILRVSARQYTVVTLLLGLSQSIAVVLILAIILSFVLSVKISKSIVKPINQLDLANPQIEDEDIYEELSPLIEKISSQNKIITQQLKEAKQKQEEFGLIIENMAEGLLIIDEKMRILTYNNAALGLLDIQKKDVMDENVLFVNRTKAFREAVEKSLKGKRAEGEMFCENSCYNLIANPVFEEEKVIGSVIVILDVTELSKREQLRREFTSNVSHELKTPLTSISGFAEMMMQGGMEQETVVDFSKSIYDEARRLISLVGDILRLSELDEGVSEPEKEWVNLKELAETTIKSLKGEIIKKKIKASVKGEQIEIFCVRKILQEMVYNLCDNGIKYNKPNGQLEITIRQEYDKVEFIVKDTGIGIPNECQSRVFERFYRVDKGRSKAIGGTGLGLAIVKHGAAYHNWSINLQSEENKGTSISILMDVGVQNHMSKWQNSGS